MYTYAQLSMEGLLMSKKETLRFKVSVSSAYSEFYEHLKEFGPYYRSRRLLELARLGYSVQKAGAVVPTNIVSPKIAPTTFGKPAPSQQSHYKFGENTESHIASMLDSLDNWGNA